MIEEIRLKRGFMFENVRTSFTVKEVILEDPVKYVLQVYDRFSGTSCEKVLTYPEIICIIYGVQLE
jgi:hypothetical protein